MRAREAIDDPSENEIDWSLTPRRGGGDPIVEIRGVNSENKMYAVVAQIDSVSRAQSDNLMTMTVKVISASETKGISERIDNQRRVIDQMQEHIDWHHDELARAICYGPEKYGVKP